MAFADEAAGEDGSDLRPFALLWLLSPYVTLATNHPGALSAPGVDEGAAPTGPISDALKVLYTTDAAAVDAMDAQLRGFVPLLLPEAVARNEVLRALEASTELVPRSARSVGTLRVGFLPVAPTWE